MRPDGDGDRDPPAQEAVHQEAVGAEDDVSEADLRLADIDLHQVSRKVEERRALAHGAETERLLVRGSPHEVVARSQREGAARHVRLERGLERGGGEDRLILAGGGGSAGVYRLWREP